MLKRSRFLLLFLLSSISVFAEQGTMTTDDVESSQSEASMSGETEEDIDLRVEEVQLEEERLEEMSENKEDTIQDSPPER